MSFMIFELLVLLQVQQDLSDLERKASLMESIMKEDTELRELTRYPFNGIL